MPTIKDIQSIAKNRGIQLPKKIRKANMIHILQEKVLRSKKLVNLSLKFRF